MNDKEKSEFINSANNKIVSVCDQVISKCVSDENYEDAAEIRDARRELTSVIAKAINNLLPF